MHTTIQYFYMQTIFFVEECAPINIWIPLDYIFLIINQIKLKLRKK